MAHLWLRSKKLKLLIWSLEMSGVHLTGLSFHVATNKVMLVGCRWLQIAGAHHGVYYFCIDC